MTERELIEELAPLGKIYVECRECAGRLNRGLLGKVGAGALTYISNYAADKMIQLVRNYAMEADKNDD